jgi:hypothetical protein
MVEYEIDKTEILICLNPLFEIPSITILLFNSKRTQNLEIQMQRVAELMGKFPNTFLS